MAKILLDYVFKIIANNPTPAASTAYLKQACVVVTAKGGYMGAAGTPVLCTTNAEIAAVTDNVEARELLAAGMSRVYVMPVADLDLSSFLEASPALNKFFTVLISSDFDKDDITATAASGNITITSYANLISGTPDAIAVAGVSFVAQSGAATLGTAFFRAATSNDATATSLAAQINAHATSSALVTAVALAGVVTITANDTGSAGNAIVLGYTDNDANIGATKSGTTLSGGDGLFLGTFAGVCGVSEDDVSFLTSQNTIANRCGFYGSSTNGAKNMCYAFGSLLANPSDWKNQQYISMPYDDDVEVLGTAEGYFDDRISFVITDDEFGSRLSLFAAGGFSIVAPYIIRNLEIDSQSKALQYISGNQPGYTFTHAALMEDELQKIIDGDGIENGDPGYIGKGWLTAGDIAVTLEDDDFVATASISVPKPRSMWRINGTLTQS